MGTTFSLPDDIKLTLGCAAAITIASVATLALFTKKLTPVTDKHAVFITGCDSGLGFSLAIYAHDLGLTVLAGCLRPDGDGAKELRVKCPDRLYIIQLDVTDARSVRAAAQSIQDLSLEKPGMELKALVNNAGVMVFGEFEWLTEKHILNQVNVNLLGTMRITKILCPLLRKYKGRIINISSHCALATLPGLTVYGATKAGLAAWSDGLRIEEAKYGVTVITFIPGSFATQSNIMARQSDYAKEMEDEMSMDDYRFFGDYFRRFNQHLSQIPVPSKPVVLQDDRLYSKFKEALLARNPSLHYVHEPLRYKFYHFLFKISPCRLRDHFIQRFICMPAWKN